MQGAGLLRLDAALLRTDPGGRADQHWKARGKGDPFKNFFKAQKQLLEGDGIQSDVAQHYSADLTGNRWSGNRWSGNRWSGTAWSGANWS